MNQSSYSAGPFSTLGQADVYDDLSGKTFVTATQIYVEE